MQYRQDNEREINLLEIMWEFLIQWKPAVLFSILFALLLMGLMYMKDMKSYKTAIVAYNSLNTLSDNDADIVTEEAKKGLTEAEHYKVENAIFNIKTINGYEEKLNAIAKIDMNGDRFNYLTLRYAGKTDEFTMPLLLGSLSDAAYDASLASILKDEDPAYADVSRVINIVNCNSSTSASYSTDKLVSEPADADMLEFTYVVNILLLKSSNINSLKKAVTAYIADADAEIKKNVPHEDIQLISVAETSTLDSVLSTSFQKTRTDAQTLRGTVATDVAAFSEDQKKLYNTLLIKEGFSEESSYMAASDNAGDESSDEKADTKQNDEKSISANSILLEEPVMPSLFSPKYALAGFVAGLFIYGVILVCIYIFSGKVYSLDEVCDQYMLRKIDEVHERRFDTAWRRFMFSKKVYDLRYAKIKKEMGEHLSSSAKYIAECAAHNELKHITVVPAYSDSAEDGLCRKYTEDLKKIWDGASVSMEISKPWTTEYTFDAPGDKEGLVILMHAGDTAFATLTNIGAYCHDYSVSVIGTILLEG